MMDQLKDPIDLHMQRMIMTEQHAYQMPIPFGGIPNIDCPTARAIAMQPPIKIGELPNRRLKCPEIVGTYRLSLDDRPQPPSKHDDFRFVYWQRSNRFCSALFYGGGLLIGNLLAL